MKIAVIGLGYVGLPLAIELGKQFDTTGFDLKTSLIEQYRQRVDPAGEIEANLFEAATRLSFTDDRDQLVDSDLFIVAVPTPIDKAKQPDLTPLRSASEIVGQVIKRGAIVVFESTVFPGATEEICVPIIETHSGLIWPRDFGVGYSPERISPGDSERTLTKIVKVVAGDSPGVLDKVANVYESIIDAGIYRAESIRVAEAAKVIENTQRDLNIAFVNELAIIFDKMGIDTQAVLRAAQTKWNFLPFQPGLVGGHCIGVDPYYLTSKAQSLGYLPEVILAGRRINDGMGKFIADTTVKKLFSKGVSNNATVLVCGLTFKENCADLRNSQVAEVVSELKLYGVTVLVTDPIANAETAKAVYGVELVDFETVEEVDAIILAVPHESFLEMKPNDYVDIVRQDGLFIDVKASYEPEQFELLNIEYWRL